MIVAYIFLQEALGAMVSNKIFDKIISVYDYAYPSIISRYDDYCGIWILLIFCTYFIYFCWLLDILQNDLSFFDVFDVVAFLVGDLK